MCIRDRPVTQLRPYERVERGGRVGEVVALQPLGNRPDRPLEPREDPAILGAPEVTRAEDRWILSRLERAIGTVTERLERYDFAHAATALYSFIWSELCDWSVSYTHLTLPTIL